MEKRSNEFNIHNESNQLHMIKHANEQILKEMIDTKVVDVTINGFVTKEPVLFKDRQSYSLKTFHIGDKWGDLFDCAWFKVEGRIPNFDSNKVYDLKLDLAGEACLFNHEGTPIKGFTNGSSAFDFNLGLPGKLYYEINDLVQKDGTFSFWIEAGANDLFGNLSNEGRLQVAEIVTRNKDYLKLYYDIETLVSSFEYLRRDNPYRQTLFNHLLEITYAILYQNDDWYKKAHEVVKKCYINDKKSNFNITAVGHAHMDLAWLWPIRETRRKIGRFMSTVLDLIKKYDDFIFGVSQPQQLAWLKADYPKLFEEVKHYVKLGRIELQGGMWVEPDTNITGEESLVRQILYGQQFYLEHFGKKVNNLWLPDVFGYSGNMPQIMKKSGLDYFMTIKISWSLINKFPYHSFKWIGIDGSSVLTHMPPEGTYNSPATPKFYLEAERNYKELKIAPIALSAYGIGNGGGGPGVEHLERIIRQKDLPHTPMVRFGRSDEFFEKLNKYEDVLPSYQGELYLENHQGTYTSQSEVKRYNRLMEQKLKAIETLLVHVNQFEKYRDELKTIWEEVLLYQFHDILPGSSIKRVYDECLERYPVLEKQIEKIREDVLGDKPSDKRFNPLLETVSFYQKIDHKYYHYEIDGLSTSKPKHIYEEQTHIFDKVFTTKNLKIQIDQNTGQLESIIYLPKNQEVLSDHANKLSVYKDLGDAWNIMDHYRKQTPETPRLISQEIRHIGPIIEIHQIYQFKKSTINETVTINQETDDIVFSHEVDWQDVGYMLRTAFPFLSKAETAIFDIQFGTLNRKRTNNNSIESAQFEMCGQQWVALDDKALKIGLINQSKYGYYVKDNLLDINLLRSTNGPCVEGDIGKTTYQYGLVIQDIKYDIDQRAMIFNTYFPQVSKDIEINRLFAVDNPNITYSTIKASEDQKAIILRLYNRTGLKQAMNLSVFRDFLIYETNLVEEDEQPTSLKQTFEPFEIKTFKIVIR